MRLTTISDGTLPLETPVRIFQEPFRNPYRLGTHGNAEQCADGFQQYANSNPGLLHEIYKLPHNTVLLCYCIHGKPHTCHGQVILELWEMMNNV